MSPRTLKKTKQTVQSEIYKCHNAWCILIAFTRRRRVVSEADLDREMDEERRRAEGQYEDSDELDDADSDDEEEEEDWKKPSAYSLLMGSLKKNSKQKDFYKKIQREQEGIEDVIESADEELVDEEEVDEEEMDDVSGDEEEQDDDLDEDEEQDDDLDEGEEQDVEGDEPVDGDAADPLEEDEEEEEEEIVYVGSDVEEDDASGISRIGVDTLSAILKITGLDDLFESRFADQQPTSFDEKISVIEQKKWVSQAFEDEVLKDVTALTTFADNTVKDMPKIESLDQVQVKQRIAKCWPKANKQVIKKSKLRKRRVSQ